jgi:predicted Zn-dependent protease
MELGLALSGIVTFNRELASSHVQLGYRKFRTGLLSDALTAFMEARRLTPEDPYVHYLIGKTLLKFGRPREARTSLKQAIRLCSTFIDVHYQLGKSYLAQGVNYLTRAQKAFETEVRVYPTHGKAYYRLSRILSERGLKAQARAAQQLAARYGFRPSVNESAVDMKIAV